MLYITKVSRLHMAAYLCVASNGVPPSISKRVQLRVQCKRANIIKNLYLNFEYMKKKKRKRKKSELYTVLYYICLGVTHKFDTHLKQINYKYEYYFTQILMHITQIFKHLLQCIIQYLTLAMPC